MLAAFCSAERVTFVGSMIPALYTNIYELTFQSIVSVALFISILDLVHDHAAINASVLQPIWRRGSSSARRMISTPVLASPSYASSTVSTAPSTFSSAIPARREQCLLQLLHAVAAKSVFNAELALFSFPLRWPRRLRSLLRRLRASPGALAASRDRNRWWYLQSVCGWN